MRKRRGLWAALISVIIILIVACVFFITAKKEPESTATKNIEETVLSIAPCDLLSDSERGVLGVGTGQENDRRNKGPGLAYRECDWRSDTLQISATLFASGSLATAATGEGTVPEAFTIGSHKAQAALAPADNVSQMLGIRTCQLDIQLDIAGDTARVRLLVGIPNDTSPRSCETAKQVAAFVEARLP